MYNSQIKAPVLPKTIFSLNFPSQFDSNDAAWPSRHWMIAPSFDVKLHKDITAGEPTRPCTPCTSTTPPSRTSTTM